jgi:oxygen-independent coproporphyrinogen-3 oxidase
MNLISKYNIPVPRYTSYPTVPFWENNLDADKWLMYVKETFRLSNSKEGISIYIHLPYCESLCTYCACNTRITVNHVVEKPYVEALLKEWQMYLNSFDEKPLIKEIHLGGGTPTFFSPENLATLLKGILSTVKVSASHFFSFEGHPSNTTVEHLTTLYQLGFDRVSFGIQDFDDKVQVAINRHQSFEEVQQIVKLARQIGYTSINFDLVYGLPFQTKSSMENTLQKVIELKPERIAFYSYAHVPWIKPGQRKFTELDLPLKKEKRALYVMGLDYFSKVGYHEVGMDHFALPGDELLESSKNGSLHRNFMGYTAGKTSLMIGLGVSSIGDSWTGFVQNSKVVEDYLQLINEGKLPIQRGHELSNQDLLMRKHILNIMCKGNTYFSLQEFGQCLFAKINKRLVEPLADGLVLIENNQLIVTKKGKAFLRNICLCFDERYHSHEVKENKFSLAI